jgi:predicted nucleic acid-binding protein
MKTNKLNCVIDTNILVASFAELSPIHWVFEKIRDQEIDISITNDIIEEYAEITAEFYSPQASKELVEMLTSSENVC